MNRYISFLIFLAQTHSGLRKSAWTRGIPFFLKFPWSRVCFFFSTPAIYWFKNEYEQIYFFFNISSWNSYELTEMSFNLRNCIFSEMFHSRVECFAPSCVCIYNQFKKFVFFSISKKIDIFTNSVFQILNIIRQSYEIFKTSVQ